MTVIIFLIVLAVLIFVHELGHFLLARANGIRVDEFKIGFGPRIFSWGKGETKYGLNLIPFGGYVKIHGEDPNEESEHGPDSARSFTSKSRWKQASVLLAGIFFNFLFAWLLFFGILAIGGTVPIAAFGMYPQYLSNPRVIVLDAEKDSPAIKAGLGIGDVITSIDDQNGKSVTVSSTTDIQKVIASSTGAAVTLHYDKNGQSQSVSVTPIKGILADRYAIGISMDNVAYVRMPFFAAIGNSFIYTVNMIRDTAVGLYYFVTGLFHGTSGIADVSGPVGIAVIIGNAAHLNISYLLIVVAIISANLGVINLVPFPALDGGRTLFVAIEGVTRRRIPTKFTNIVNTVGFGLLMALMVFVTYKDIVRLFM